MRNAFHLLLFCLFLLILSSLLDDRSIIFQANDKSSNRQLTVRAYAQEDKETLLHPISVNGSDFVVRTIITSGAVVKNVTLDISSKTLKVDVDNPEGISNIQFMTLIFESEMLGGQYSVMYDDMHAELNKHYSVGLEQQYTIFAIAFPKNVNMIYVTGTTVTPEFPILPVVAGIGVSIIIVLVRTKALFKI